MWLVFLFLFFLIFIDSVAEDMGQHCKPGFGIHVFLRYDPEFSCTPSAHHCLSQSPLADQRLTNE